MSGFAADCDDFGASVYLSSKLEINTGREPVLHFFDAARRQFPALTELEKRDGNEYVLEEDRESGIYQWVSVDPKRVAAGSVNPTDAESADRAFEWLLDVAPYHFDLSALDADSLDLMYFFDYEFAGNHDEVVAEALAANGPLDGLLKHPTGQMLHFQPNLMMALDEGCLLQFRMSIETRTNLYHVRTGNYPESPISVYCSARQSWAKNPFPTFRESYRHQKKLLDEIVADVVVPGVLRPLAKTIAARG